MIEPLGNEAIAKFLNDRGLTVGRTGRPFHDIDISPRELLIAQEQLRDALKKVYHWGLEDCPHAGHVYEDALLHKKDCYVCWQELQVEGK